MGYPDHDPAAQAQIAALRQELQKLGWEEGRNVRVDVRFPAADAGNVRSNLAELMSLAPDVLVSNTNLVTAIAQAEVRTIPIVFTFVGEPVLSGFVSNDTRPNSNLTGFANWDSPAMSGKWLELLNEVAPQIERVGFMMHPETPAHVRFFKSAEALAPSLKLKFVPLDVHDEAEIEADSDGIRPRWPRRHYCHSARGDAYKSRLHRRACRAFALARALSVGALPQSRGPDLVWPRSGKSVSAGSGICRPHTARRQAR